MSQIINAIPPDALLPVAGALVGWVGHMLWFRSERAHVAAGMARIRAFMRGNDEWLTGQQREFKAADVTPEPAPLALSDRSHADEQADHTDTDRAGMWRVLLGLASDLALRVWHFPTALGNGFARWVDETVEYLRDRFKTNAQRDAEYRQVLDDAIEVDEDFEAAVRQAEAAAVVEPEPVRIVRVNRYRDPGMTGQFPYVKVAGAPRHAAPEPEMPAINATIPAQRTGDGNA